MGIAGVAGNGQDELMLALSGERIAQSGSLTVDGVNALALNPTKRRMLGLLAAPEERLGHSAAPDMSLTENTIISAFDRQKLGSRGFIDFRKAQDYAKKVIAGFDVRTPSENNAAKSLSGGNLQKFVVGREIMQNPKVFAVNQPTWGVDAAAAAFIRQEILELAARGAGAIVISQDLDELFEISDTMAVLNEGTLSEARPASEVTMEQIGLLMGGMAA